MKTLPENAGNGLAQVNFPLWTAINTVTLGFSTYPPENSWRGRAAPAF